MSSPASDTRRPDAATLTDTLAKAIAASDADPGAIISALVTLTARVLYGYRKASGDNGMRRWFVVNLDQTVSRLAAADKARDRTDHRVSGSEKPDGLSAPEAGGGGAHACLRREDAGVQGGV